MLSERDHRILRDIERHLEGDDPRLVSAMQRQDTAERRARLRHDVTAVLAGIVGLACLLLPGARGAGLIALGLALVAFSVGWLRFTVPGAPSPGRRVTRTMQRWARRAGYGTSI
ncbi:DUF3040 domain-containing protein [Pseudonocardia sp. GCM10023141]|uniref:DUF3040 domain-containing protein n=1 Tax=Pseudonocardia sp. GCM10023141 TaxID=3252653 RepID=UPI00360AE073